MPVALAAVPPDDRSIDDFWDFEPDADETFEFDPTQDRKWDAFLLDEDDLGPRPDEILPL